jgi:hypothetical protein
VLTVATLFWQANQASRDFSRCYDESWVEKLYRGFARHLSAPFRFVCYVDRDYVFCEPIEQRRISARVPDYSTCIEPYELGVPMILCGLDTMVTGNLDGLAAYCMTGTRLALPRDPYNKRQACNGVALIPAGHERVAATHSGENDMVWVRGFDHVFIDDLFPGQVESYKGGIMRQGLGDARIVYFHGQKKPHQLYHKKLIQEHWI